MSTEAERHAACCELVHDVAGRAGAVSLLVRGVSMLPAIRPGDRVTVRRCGLGALEPGQVVLYRRGGRLTAHRIQQIKGNRIVTRGDSVSCFDPPVEESEIVGRVESVARGSRSVDPAQSRWQRVAAWILRHSDFSMRATLYVSRRVCRSWNAEAARLSASPLPGGKE